jgi:hypothetical protein
MRLIFCLPGKSFSANFFNSWNQTCNELNKLGIAYAYSNSYDPVVYYTRNRILGGQNTAGPAQLPWQGAIEYDKMIWIDDDIVWRPDDILALIKHDLPIVAGTYMMSDGQHFPLVEQLDYSYLSRSGVFKFMTKEDISKKTQPFTVSYTGFGFVCIKKGILESMEYPWFRPRWVSTDEFHDFCAEDVGFCWTAQEKGHEIWIDPSIRVGHEKIVML